MSNPCLYFSILCNSMFVTACYFNAKGKFSLGAEGTFATKISASWQHSPITLGREFQREFSVTSYLSFPF